LEAKVERGRLTYTRKAVDRIPAGKQARFFKKLREQAPSGLGKNDPVGFG